MDAIFESFLGFDLSVFEWVQGIQNSVLTTIMVVITTLGDEGIIFIVAGLVMLFTKKYRKIGLSVLVALVVMLVLNNLVIKELLERVRPFYLFNLDALLADKQAFIDAGRLSKFDTMVEKITAMTANNPEMAEKWLSTYQFPEFVDKLTSFSFPSGHTSSAFAACFAVFVLDKKIGIPALVFAALMGFSRIYVEVHYCTDVLGAAVMGILYALIGLLIAKYLFPLVDKAMDAVFSKLKRNKKEA